jgi:hypothetical protein
MSKIVLNKPIKVKLADGREIEQEYLEFSDITVDDSIKYLGNSFLGKKMEFMDIMCGLYDDVPEEETQEEKDKRELDAGIQAGKEFFKIFDDKDIIDMVCALSKMPRESIGTIPFFALSDMVGEILPFLLPSQIPDGKE